MASISASISRTCSAARRGQREQHDRNVEDWDRDAQPRGEIEDEHDRGQDQANALGNVSFTRFVSGVLSGKTFWFQVMETGRASNWEKRVIQ